MWASKNITVEALSIILHVIGALEKLDRNILEKVIKSGSRTWSFHLFSTMYQNQKGNAEPKADYYLNFCVRKRDDQFDADWYIVKTDGRGEEEVSSFTHEIVKAILERKKDILCLPREITYNLRKTGMRN